MFIIAEDFFVLAQNTSCNFSLLVEQLLFLPIAYSEMCIEVSTCVSAIFYVIDFKVFVWVCRKSTAHGFHFKLNIRPKAEVKTSANQSNGHLQIEYLNISLQQLNHSQIDSQKLIEGLVHRVLLERNNE